MKEVANFPLQVKNEGNRKTELEIEPVFPDKKHLREGFEPIPDLTWVSVEKKHFVLKPFETAVTDIIISIPDEKQNFGKKYQVNFWSHTVGGKGFVIASGLESVLLITTDKVKRKVTYDQLKKATFDLNFTVQPTKIFVENVKVGKMQDVEKSTGTILKIHNPSNESHTYKIQSLSVKQSKARLENGYNDCPDPSFLSFDTNEVVVGPEETKEIKMYLKFPKKRKYRKKKYMFIIYTTVQADRAIGGMYTRLYVSTR
jgi:hypothetical protein